MPFPVPSTKLIKEFHAPALLLTGDHTLPVLQRCVDAVTARLPESERVLIRDATHDMWSERPQECDVALRKLLRENSRALALNVLSEIGLGGPNVEEIKGSSG